MNHTNTSPAIGARKRFLRLLLAAFALSAVVLVPSSPSAATARTTVPAWADGVDIAEDGTRFVFDENGPVLENGYPDYGNSFVVSQTAPGFNASEGINLTVDLELVGAPRAAISQAILRF